MLFKNNLFSGMDNSFFKEELLSRRHAMKSTEQLTVQPSVVERVFKVENENRLLSVKLAGQSWVSVCKGEKEILRNRRHDRVVKFFLRPGTYTIKTDGIIEDVTPEDTQPDEPLMDRFKRLGFAQLRLASDASKRHEVDGISEITADGKSFCTISVEKTGPDGNSLIGSEHRDTIYLRSTGGTLLDSEENKRIRSLELKAGKGKFRLKSEKQPKVVTVSVFGKAPTIGKAELQIEFV
jgi:hypothetical protein